MARLNQSCHGPGVAEVGDFFLVLGGGFAVLLVAVVGAAVYLLT